MRIVTAAYKHKTRFLLGTKCSFPDGSVGKESTCNAGSRGDIGSIPGWDRYPEGKNGIPLQYSCLENPMDRKPGGLQLKGSIVRHD